MNTNISLRGREMENYAFICALINSFIFPCEEKIMSGNKTALPIQEECKPQLDEFLCLC
jgi:hypothetical protein